MVETLTFEHYGRHAPFILGFAGALGPLEYFPRRTFTCHLSAHRYRPGLRLRFQKSAFAIWAEISGVVAAAKAGSMPASRDLRPTSDGAPTQFGAALEAETLLAEEMQRHVGERQPDLVAGCEMVLASDDGQHLLATDVGMDNGFGAERLGQLNPGRDAALAAAQGDMLRPHSHGEARAGPDRALAQRHRERVAAGDGDVGGAVVDGGDIAVQEVHMWRADEAGNEAVGRPVVQLQRRAHLLDAARAAPRCCRRASSPRPGRG